MAVLFNRIALIGLGLIGSSLSHIIRREKLAGHIAAYDHDHAIVARAQKIGLADSFHETASGAVDNADLIMLCIPVGAYEKIALEIGPVLKKWAILSDVGSVKAAIIHMVQPHLPSYVHFIPGHPLAGTENSGPEAGFASLFAERWCILTPLPDCDVVALEKVRHFWKACGSMVDIMSPTHHDMVLAITSHLPHLIAYNIVATVADLETITQSEVIKYSASGFRDFTRIGASDPVMWRDIFLNNRHAVLEMLGRFSEDLALLQRAIRWGDGEKLYELFSRACEIRRAIPSVQQQAATENDISEPA